MKVIKNINNNVSLCLDSQGREVVAFGKGIGFTKPPYEVPLSQIQRTFYNIDESYLSVLVAIPEEMLNVAAEIYDYGNRKMNNCFSSNVVFTLADHIRFAIKREEENISIKLPLFYEVQNLYPEEIEIGIYALKLINERFNVHLPKEEAASITLHFVGYGLHNGSYSGKDEKIIMDQCTEIVEQMMEIHIDKKSFNYSRFLTHLHYLLDRVKHNKTINTENGKVYEELKKQYPKTYECVKRIEAFLTIELNDEERLYLILHINRLCSYEDYFQ
ncbi:MAG: PRD domain-containing protein [Lachnospiraceae bacterium]|jgi:beta-glucoside operon transcriptional antiterminator|nr:PRD domain-containing protein [Lachnospiraceae bacterium]